MNFLESLLLGLVQGLTEFLPISSSAHVSIVGQLLPGNVDPGAAFTAITQLGTEMAVLLYFRRDIVRIVSAWCRSLVGKVARSDPDARMGWLIIIGSVPIGLAGIAFEDWIDTTLRNLYVTAAMLILFGLLLGWFDSRGSQQKDLTRLGYRDGVFYGLAQCLALIPGVSRSGATITAGLAMGYTREAAARYSFLLAMPAVFASGLYKVAKVMTADDAQVEWAGTIGATLVAFVVGYLVIIAFLKIVSNYSYKAFVWYRLGLGALLLVLLGTGVLAAS